MCPSSYQAYVDYKKPIGDRDDFRTSSYIGHRYIPSVTSGNFVAEDKIDTNKFYDNQSKIQDNYLSETGASYTVKFPDPTISRNARLHCKNILYTKPYDTVKFKNVPRPLQGYDTVYHKEYPPKFVNDPELILPQIPPNKPLQKSTVLIDPEKPGYAKHLDLMASTNKLDYPHYSIDSTKGIAEKNNITVWNWFNIYQPIHGAHKEQPAAPKTSKASEEMCGDFCSAECPKRRNEFPSLIKHVPNSGLTTEVRVNYIRPNMDNDPSLANLQQPSVLVPPKTVPPWSTESSIYGSGDCVHRHLNIARNKKH